MLGEIKPTDLTQVATALRDISQSFAMLKTNDISGTGITSFMNSVSRFDGAKFSSGSFESVMSSFNTFAATDMSKYNEKINNFANALVRLSAIDTSKFNSELSNFMMAMAEFAQIDMTNYSEKINLFMNAIVRLAKIDTLSTFSPEIVKFVEAMALFASVDMSGYNEKISNFVNALKRLAEVDMSNYNASINTFVSAMAQFAAIDMSGYDVEIVKFVNSLGRLAKIDSTKASVETIRDITQAISEFIVQMANAPQVSDNTVRMAEALAQLGGKAKSLKNSLEDSTEQMVLFEIRGESIVNAAKAIRDAFRTLDSGIRKFSSSAVGAFKTAISKIEELTKHKPNVESLNISFTSLLKTLLGFKGLTGVFSWIKESINLGAAVTEIDHIVESVFTKDMVGYVNEWADNAITKFGIAATSAKKYAGTLTSMFQASLVDAKDAGKMAMDLVELAGDLSAFYNIDTATAYKKIQSGMAGMVRPLRDLGIDLSVATLKQYALSKGIEKSYTDMTQAEKVMLRYEYLMENTANQSGDFQRTNLSLANSLRTLKAYLTEISTEFGAGLGAALRHVVIWLNKVASAALKAAQVFRTFMETIFGKYKGGASGIAFDASYIDDASDSAADLDDSANGAASALGDADTNAKKLKKDLSVLPFDELNQLSKDTSKASDKTDGIASGLGGYGDALLDGLDFGNLEDKMSEFSSFVERWANGLKIYFNSHDWEMLGRALAQGLNKGINYLYGILNPDDVAKKINPWIDAFTRTFNSFTKYLDFEKLGRTLGEGIDIIISAANRVLDPKTGINWKQLGSKLGEGANGLVDEIKWDELGQFFANKINFPWDIAYGFVTEFDWAALGDSFAEGANNFVDKIDFATMADTVSVGLNGIVEAVQNFLTDFDASEFGAKLGANFKRMIDGVSWESLGNALANIWNEAWEFLKSFVMNLGEGSDGLSIQDAIDEKLAIKNGKNYTGGKLRGTGLGKVIRDTMTGALDSIQIGDMTDAANRMFQKVFQDIQEVFGKTENWYKLGHMIGTAIGDIIGNKDTMKDAANAVTAIADGIKALLKGAIDALMEDSGDIVDGLKTFFTGLPWNEIFLAITGIVAFEFAKAIPLMFGGVLVKKALTKTISKAITESVGSAAGSAASGGAAVGGGVASGLAQSIFGTLGTTAGVAGITAGFVKVGESAKKLFEKIQGGNGMFTESGDAIQKYIDRLHKFGDISETTYKQLFLLKESWESGNINDDTFFSQFAEILKQGGINADNAKGYLELLKQEIVFTDTELETLDKAISEMGGATEGAGGKITQFSANSEEAFGKIQAAFAEAIGTMQKEDIVASTHLAEALDYFKKLKDAGYDNVTAFQKMCTEFGITGNTADTLASALQSQLGEGAFEVLSGKAGTLSAKIGGVASKLGTLKTKAEESHEAIKGQNEAAEEAPSLLDTFKEKLGEVGTEILTSIGNRIASYNATKGSMEEAGRGFEEGKTDVLKPLEKISGDIDKELGTWEKLAKDSGKEIPEGASAGIKATASKVKTATETLADDALKWFNSKAGIASPSTVFEATSENIPLGVAKGIGNRTYEVESSVSTLVSSTIGQRFTEELNSLDSELESRGERLVDQLTNGFITRGYYVSFGDLVYDMFDGVLRTHGTLDRICDSFEYWGAEITKALVSGMRNIRVPEFKVDEFYQQYTYPNGTTIKYLKNLSPRWYAKGALFTNATIAGLGEAGDEAALPLENKRTMTRIATAITDNMDGVGMDAQELTSAVTQGYIAAMMATQNSDNNNQVFNITVKTMNDEVLARAVQRGNASLQYRNNPQYS